ncbi:hypothetical protein A8F94_08250 [Bacillus sp. FJAT-27225]|uniref:DUF624 domain-containing protein n=1 Tax=Bacillus sp. FJAT-27225 TaxID=1743144 RepID=UPI00080C2926|nr:hypothetical protein A8F94_08250 [Bacillus sp. FJAT-27225]
MNFLHSKYYYIFEKISNFLLLNLLWLLLSMPVIILLPATAAMFGVIRSWIKNKETSVIRVFFELFKENFKHSLLFGIIWAIYAASAYINLVIAVGYWKVTLTLLLIALGIILTFMTVYIFPVMVHYQTRFIELMQKSLYFSVRFLPFTILCILLFIGTIAVMIHFPVSSLIVPSLAAYVISIICLKTFNL